MSSNEGAPENPPQPSDAPKQKAKKTKKKQRQVLRLIKCLPDGTVQLLCYHCSFVTNNTVQLFNHEKSEHPTACPICCIMLGSVSILKLHMKNLHSNKNSSTSDSPAKKARTVAGDRNIAEFYEGYTPQLVLIDEYEETEGPPSVNTNVLLDDPMWGSPPKASTSFGSVPKSTD